jgi:hypothetical protein
MVMFIRAGIGDKNTNLGWEKGQQVTVKGDDGVSYVLDGVYPTRLGPGHDQGSPIYLLGGHETYRIHVDQPKPLVQEICEVVVRGLGNGQPRDVLAALVHLADCWQCIDALRAISESMPADPHKPSVSDLFNALRDRIRSDEGERLRDRLRRPQKPPS